MEQVSFSLKWMIEEWKMVEVKVMTVMRWYAQDEVNQEDSEQGEVDRTKKGADSTGEVMHIETRAIAIAAIHQ